MRFFNISYITVLAYSSKRRIWKMIEENKVVDKEYLYVSKYNEEV
jgi:hypothetical protein